MNYPTLVAAAGLTSLLSSMAAAQPRFSFDYPALAHRLVAQLAPVKGERVLIVAHPGFFEALIPHVRYEVMKAGAIDLGVVDVLGEPVPAGWDPAVLQAGAYGFSMSSQYNSRPRAAEALVEGRRWRVVRERERLSDITRGERP